MTTRSLALVLIALGVLQPLAGAFSGLTGLGAPIGAASSDTGAADQPLPAFFAIWGVIFLAYLGFGLALCVKPAEALRPVAVPLIAAGAANVVWMLTAQLVVTQPLDFVLLAPIAFSAWLAARRYASVPAAGPTAAGRLADAASGLLAGWISVACAISVPLTIRTFTSLGPTDYPWQFLALTLALAGLAAAVFTRVISRTPWFFAALLWGLAGIALSNLTVTGLHLPGIVTAAFALGLLLWRLTQRPKRAKPPA